MSPPTTTLLLACQAALLSAAIFAPSSQAFVPSSIRVARNDFQRDANFIQQQQQETTFVFGPESSLTSLSAAGGKKRKKRRRKDQPAENSAPDEAKSSPAKVESLDKIENAEDVEEITEEDIFTLKDVAKFAFDEDRAASMSKSWLRVFAARMRWLHYCRFSDSVC